MIEVRNLTKYYGNGESRFKALDDVTVNISDGEFIVILGASGSGKSTFLNVISGLEEIDGGSVTYDGRQLENMSENIFFSNTICFRISMWRRISKWGPTWIITKTSCRLLRLSA